MSDITSHFCLAGLFVAARLRCVWAHTTRMNVPSPEAPPTCLPGNPKRVQRQRGHTETSMGFWLWACIISRFVSQLWKKSYCSRVWIWIGSEKKSLNENRRDLCFYSTEIECNWEWIRFAIGEIREYSPGLFLHTVEWFQFSETGIPGIWFHFICWQRGQSRSVCLLRNSNQIALCVWSHAKGEHVHVW